MTTADAPLQPRDVARRALRATLERMEGPWHPDYWQTLGDLRERADSAPIPGKLLNFVMATLVNAGRVKIGDEVCEGDGCPRMVRTYALTDAGRIALERTRADLQQAPWTLEATAAATARIEEQRKRAARRKTT